MLLSQLDQFDRAKADFELATHLGQETDIGYLAAAQEALLAGDAANAARFARDGIGKGSENPSLLIVLGEALVRSGVVPGENGFTEAQNALEKASLERPNDVSAQIALGQINLASSRLDDAVMHLERARQMQPNNPSIYANLAKAYQRRGDSRRAQQALTTLQTLNEAQAERIRSAPGDRKMGYGGEIAGSSDSLQH
jgi:predicted Zn-dependent protease